MIQRIQSIYLAISIILLSIVAVGADVFHFVGKNTSFVFNSFGIQQVKNGDGEGLAMVSKYPLYIGLIALVLLLFITLMSFKNLKRQLKLVRTVFYIYVLMIIGLVVFSVVGIDDQTDEPLKRQLGAGFFLFVAGLPFVFMANLSIKRDKGLIDSLNRLR
jgi:amino acid transporter